MTVTRTQVRAAIRNTLLNVDGLDSVYAYRPGSPNPPCAIVPLFGYNPQLSFHSTVWRATVPILVLVAFADAEAADQNLGALMEEGSIIAALGADPSFGLTNVDSNVIELSDAEVLVLTGADVLYLATTVTLDVIAT